MPLRVRPFTVAIAGGSGSGKTSLTRALVAALGSERCAVLDHDSYYRDLAELPLAQLQAFHPLIGADAMDVLTLRGSLQARQVRGGTAPAQAQAQIARHRARLQG